MLSSYFNLVLSVRETSEAVGYSDRSISADYKSTWASRLRMFMSSYEMS